MNYHRPQPETIGFLADLWQWSCGSMCVCGAGWLGRFPRQPSKPCSCPVAIPCLKAHFWLNTSASWIKGMGVVSWSMSTCMHLKLYNNTEDEICCTMEKTKQGTRQQKES